MNGVSEVVEIKVVTRLQDNGDGGYTLFAYNTEDELIANHSKSYPWDPSTKSWPFKEMSQEQREEILNEEDPYKNGYIGRDTIKVKITSDGVFLAEPLCFGLGQ